MAARIRSPLSAVRTRDSSEPSRNDTFNFSAKILINRRLPSGNSMKSFDFGDFRVEVDERRLLHKGVDLPLSPKLFDTLSLLVQNSGHLVTKEEFLRRIWPGI